MVYYSGRRAANAEFLWEVLMSEDVFAIYNSLSVAYKKEVYDYMMFLSEKSAREKSSKFERKPGTLKGKFFMSEDFDAPLDDFAEYMK